MTSQNPHTGGRLEDMAPTGTRMPNDAGLQNVDQTIDASQRRPEDTGYTYGNLATAADNATDIPRSTRDTDYDADIVTGTGDTLPTEVETKRLHMRGNDAIAKGHDRYAKHVHSNRSDFVLQQGEGAAMEPAPGEEGDSQDTIQARHGGIDRK